MANSIPQASNASAAGENTTASGQASFDPHYIPPPNDKTTPFHLLTSSNFEPGVTISHYEFYTLITFSPLLPNQRSFARPSKSKDSSLLCAVYAAFIKPSSSHLPDPYNAPSTTPKTRRDIGRGIYRIDQTHHISYCFENSEIDFANGPCEAMGAFLINQEGGEPNGTVVINLGRDYSREHARARREAGMVPPVGYMKTPGEKGMSGKLRRIYNSCRIMKLGTVQNVRCTECEAKPKTKARECRKLDGVQRCLWCTHGAKKCRLPGEDDVYDEDENGGEGGNDGDDDDKPKRKFVRRRRSERLKSIGDAKAADVAGSKTLGGRVDKRRSCSRRRSRDHGMQAHNPGDDEEDDHAIQSDDSAIKSQNPSDAEYTGIPSDKEMDDIIRETRAAIVALEVPT